MRYRYTMLASQRTRFVDELTNPSTVAGNQGLIVGAPLIDRGMVCDGLSRGIAWNGAVIDPLQLPGLLALINPSATASIVRSAPSTLVDMGFDNPGSWTGAVAGEAEITGSQAVFTATTGVRQLYQTGVNLAGEQYYAIFDVASSNGQLVVYTGSYPNLGIPGQTGLVAIEYASNNGRLGPAAPIGRTAAYNRIVSIDNLSFNSIASLAGVAGGFQQLTSASKLWVSRTTVNGRQVVEANSDYMTHTAPASTWNVLHRDQDWYWFQVVQPTSLAALRSLTSTRSINSAVAVGMGAYINTTGTYSMNIGNGAATVVTGVSPVCFAAGTPALLVVRHSIGGNVEAWVGGTRVLNLAPAAAWDTASVAAGLSVGSLLVTASTNPMVGRFGHYGVGAAVLTDSMLSGLGAWAKEYYGVVWV